MRRSQKTRDSESDRLREELDATRRALEESERQRKALEDKYRAVDEENKKLRERLSRLEGSPGVLALSDKTAEAGGVPSSKVYYRRPTPDAEKKPTGGQPGHPGRARRRPTPNQPPVHLTLDRCTDCGHRLPEPADALVRTITDLPPATLHVYEEHRYRYWCGACGSRVTAQSLLSPYEQWGPRLVAFVAHHRMLALSLQKIQGILQESYGLHVGEAALLGMEAHVARLLGPRYAEILAQVRASGVVHGDETKFRVGGANGWLWTFATINAVLYEVAPTRGHTVPERVLEDYDGVLVRDAWDPYDVVKSADHQLDGLHINRWLERAEVKAGVEPRPLVKPRLAKLTRRGRPPEHLLRFADAVRGVLREAIAFVEADPPPSKEARLRAYPVFRNRLKRIVDSPGPHPDAVRIAKELRSRLDQVFTFVRIAGVPWHNNLAENAIRQGVLHRKIAGGRRTWPGAARLQALLSVFQTCKKTKENFVGLVQGLLAQEALASKPTPSVAP